MLKLPPHTHVYSSIAKELYIGKSVFLDIVMSIREYTNETKVYALWLYLSSVFDTISHKKLLYFGY